MSCHGEGSGWLGTNEVSPQLPEPGGEPAFVPSHPIRRAPVDQARAQPAPGSRQERIGTR
jgi:hypothetical protein